MGSVSFHGFSYSNYGYGTWTTTMSFDFDMSGLDSGSYDVKYFYHVQGGSDSGHWAGFNIWWPGYGGTISKSFSLQLPPRTTYIFDFELFHLIDGQDPISVGGKFSNEYAAVPPPPIQYWSWNNDTGSYNQVNKNDNSQYLFASRDAVSTSGKPTVNFKRQTWNDLIDWLIYVYKQATNNAGNVNINDQSFYPSGTTGRAYLTSVNSHPDPIIFRASNWNLMSYIGNSTARALGGSNFISQVSTGDLIESHIFSDVIDEINRLIRIYNTH